jgi:chromosome partitioning protein
MLVTIGNQKGGVGKSTMSCNLAAMSVLAGKKTLLVDTDMQKSSLNWADLRQDNENIVHVPCFTKYGRIGKDLAMLKAEYDVIIVDCGGKDSTEMRQAITVSDIFIAPMKPSQFDMWAVNDMESLILDIEEKIESKINANILINGCSSNQFVKESQVFKESLKEYADVFNIMNSEIADRKIFRDASMLGLSIFEYKKDDKSSSINNARQEMKNLYKEIFNYDYEPA